MAYTTISKHTDYFNTKLYTGNSGTLNVTGVGHQPDFVWIKDMSSSGDDYAMYDVVRGVNKRIRSNQNDAENTESAALTSFDSDGFTVGTAGSSNGNGDSFVSWNWKTSGSQGSSNTDGSINTTYTSVNTTAGFSISKYVGTGSAATVGHGLSAVPKFLMIKDLSASTDWTVYHEKIGNAKRLVLNTNNGEEDDASFFNDTSPTSSVFSIGSSSAVNLSGRNYICYAFTDIIGYSKFNSYKGNENDNGTFVYTGFAPKLIIIKRNGTDNFNMNDSARSSNPNNNTLRANTSDVPYTGSAYGIDLLSNGFKIRNDDGNYNNNGVQYVYMCWGQSIVGSNNVACTAR
tara:strand:+ start:702 stop:1736 length:1035 start_codon:yes stop_codon:yes gene_type:complete